MYQGFYLLTWPYTVKWGALAIALGFFVPVLWIQSLAGPAGAGPAEDVRRDVAEIRQILGELRDERKEQKK